MNPKFAFLPAPRRVSFTGGTLTLEPKRLMVLDDPRGAQALRSAAARAAAALEKLGLAWEQSASHAVPAAEVGLTLRVAPQRSPNAQGYRLHVTPDGILIEGHDPAGVFYGVCTLVQILQQAGREVPCLEIQDWPDIAARGVMLDISRDKVYRMDYLYELVDRLAGWKINQLQLYTEHTFAYRSHPLVWEHASPMTGEEIMALDAYCQDRFIELVPNQNSFGHMERWLSFSPYAALAETNDWFTAPWGEQMKGPFSLAPLNPGSLDLVLSMYDELLPHFSSKLFNVGCDETIDLGCGASKQACEERGKGRVYLDYLLKIYADVKKRGYTLQFWGDILNNNHPELVADLPRDLIALNWGYEANHPFNVEAGRCASFGVPFYVCPGTSSWTSLAGRTENAIGNLRNAAENGVCYGAIGYLNTDWGDRGHWQAPPVSWLGFVVGAAYSWGLEANRDMDVAGLTSRYAFEDPSGVMGQVAYDLGNVYQATEIEIHNGTALFWAMQKPLADLRSYPLSQAALARTREAIDAAIAPMDSAKMDRPDADLIRAEFHSTARILHHGLKRAELALQGSPTTAQLQFMDQDLGEFLEGYQDLWLKRARPGGLKDSLARFDLVRQEYRSEI